MFAWVLQITLISIILIFLVHNLFYFFKSMLTIPKIKDLVDSPSEKYKQIFNQMTNANTNTSTTNTTNISGTYTKKDLLPAEDSMKRDLKQFLKKQLNVNQSDNTTDIFSLEESKYSPYSS